MTPLWSLWWVWAIGAIVLGILEVLSPAYIFLGFACGAAVAALALIADGAIGIGVGQSLPMLGLIFAIASLVSWLLLRRVLGVREGQRKNIDYDVNE